MNPDPILARVESWVGRSYADLRCWDLIAEAFALRGTPLRGDLYQILFTAGDTFRTVFDPEPWDVVPVINHRLPIINHVGLYLGESRFIHSVEDQGVVITKLHQQPWSERIVHESGRRAFLRHRR
jgi:hypothetical protein